MTKPIKRLFQLARSHFWGLLLIILSLFFIKISKIGGLVLLSIINSEYSVRQWVNNGYSYTTGYAVAIVCGSLSLYLYFVAFKYSARLIHKKYPKINNFIEKVLNTSRVQGDESKITNFTKWLCATFAEVVNKNPRLGLILIGFMPFCGVIGIPIVLSSHLKKAFWYMALGNILKILFFGLVLANNILLLCLIAIIFLLVYLSTKQKIRPV